MLADHFALKEIQVKCSQLEEHWQELNSLSATRSMTAGLSRVSVEVFSVGGKIWKSHWLTKSSVLVQERRKHG